MSATEANVIQFLRGLQDNLPETPDSDTLYFTTDTHHIYLGADQLAQFTAGNGITFTDDVIAIDKLAEGDMDDIIPALPSTSAFVISDLGDVAISSPVNGQVLTYDSTSGEWINSSSMMWNTFTS